MKRIIVAAFAVFGILTTNVSAAGIDIGITHTDGYEFAYNFLNNKDEGTYLQHSAIFEQSESKRNGYDGSVRMSGISYKFSAGWSINKNARIYGLGKIGYVHSSGEQTYPSTGLVYTGDTGASVEIGVGIRGAITEHVGYYFETVAGSRAKEENRLQGFPQDESLKGTLGIIFIF